MEWRSIETCRVWVLLFLSVAAIGCRWQRPASETAALTAASTEDDSTEWTLLQRVLGLPADPSLDVADPRTLSPDMFRIQTPETFALDGRRFVLLVDDASQAAWIQVSGGLADHLQETRGPWRLTEPDIQQLIAAVR